MSDFAATPPSPEPAVSAVCEDRGYLLMVRRGHGPAGGTWSLPGGRIQSGETIVEALVRETREETGLGVVAGPFLGINEMIQPGAHFVIVVHEVTVLESARPVAGGDAAEAEWVELGDVASRALAPGLAEFLHDHGVIETFA